MLAVAAVEEVRALLAAGLGQRATARTTGISRGTVAAIAHDRWASVWRRRAELRAADAPPAGPCPEHPHAPRPCTICRAKAALAKRSPESLRELFAPHGPLELELRPNERTGYIEVRRKLILAGEVPPDDDLADPNPRAV